MELPYTWGMRFGERLKGLREAAGLSQARLAQASGIPLPTLRDYEQGKRRRDPGYEFVLRICRALDLPLDAFADCFESPAPKKARAAPSTPPAAELAAVAKKKPA